MLPCHSNFNSHFLVGYVNGDTFVFLSHLLVNEDHIYCTITKILLQVTTINKLKFSKIN